MAYATGSSTTGDLTEGIGVQLLEDLRLGNAMVMPTISGGPAALAGVLPGDATVRVDGEYVKGQSGDVMAAKCKGAALQDNGRALVVGMTNK